MATKQGRTVHPAPEKHFISDKNISNELKWHQDHTLVLYVIELSDLIDHLKKAAAGLQSETFLCTAEGLLSLRSGISIKSVLPEVLADYAQPFLFSGNAYRSLKARFQCVQPPSGVEHPMHRALRHAIIVFLTNTRLFLLSQPANTLSELLRSSTPTMQLLRQLEQLFQHNHNPVLAAGGSGANLLSNLWSAIDASVNRQYLYLLTFLLKSLCETYFGQLQRWIYMGEIDEPFNELFIRSCSGRSLDRRSKEFFDRGFHVLSDVVPGFLSGYEMAVLQCGKYNCLLRTYKAEHLVFSLKHPDLVVCLSELELQKMRNNLEIHYNRVMHNVKPFSIKNIFEQRAESMQSFGNRMWNCTQEHLIAWDLRQRELQLKANAEIKRRNDLLTQQISNDQNIRLEKQRMGIIDELVYQRNCDNVEEQSLLQNKEAIEREVADLQKNLLRTESGPIVISPNESSSSCRSFVSCLEEPNLEEILKEKPSESSGSVLKQYAFESHENNLNDNATRNRERNMSSVQFRSCQTLVELHQHHPKSISSEAEHNRFRVLNCTDLRAQLPPDENMNLEEISDLQRNRQRMHHHYKFGSTNSNEDEISDLGKNDKQTNTLTASNHRHVLENDLNKGLDLLLEEPMLKVFNSIPLLPATPMSTTSDMEVDFFKDAIPIADGDAANNNSHENQTADMVYCSTDKPSVLGVSSQKADELLVNHKRKREISLSSLQLQRKSAENTERMKLGAKNSFIIKHYVKQSILIPLKMHLSLLRNEVLRIFHELNIYEHFLHLRNYFFLLDGEFGNQLVCGILRNIEAGMEPRCVCQKGILDSILNNALGSRASDLGGVRSGADALALFVENLTLNCSNIQDFFDPMNIDALSAFTLHWKLNWPLNLIISVESLSKYTQIFSHLLKLRHVSVMLDRSYQYLQQLGKLHGRALFMSAQYRYLQMVRYKLSHFLITLQNHLDTNVFQVTWQAFNEKLCSVDSVEGLYHRHAEYLKQIVFLCLLNRQSAKFMENIEGVLVIVLRFCKTLHSQTFVLDKGQQFVHPRYKSLLQDEVEFDRFVRYVIYLAKKMAASGYQDKIIELIRNLNFNNYYNVSSQM
ncbi:hypothetical protein KR222_002373 [Zaprionus bogoriensis]|nr:hypothetical protein KR222_002373 [Zaprionus bogoriensis]